MPFLSGLTASQFLPLAKPALEGLVGLLSGRGRKFRIEAALRTNEVTEKSLEGLITELEKFQNSTEPITIHPAEIQNLAAQLGYIKIFVDMTGDTLRGYDDEAPDKP